VASFPEEWRLVGALEALVGFLLIGWSTAFMVQTLRRIID
jgi:ascorbate-specific PTS system EIIC-type component UlaA